MAFIYNIKQFFLRLWRGNEKPRNNLNKPNKRKVTPFYRNKHGYPETLNVCERDDDNRT
jgi:hypothetical protein